MMGNVVSFYKPVKMQKKKVKKINCTIQIYICAVQMHLSIAFKVNVLLLHVFPGTHALLSELQELQIIIIETN